MPDYPVSSTISTEPGSRERQPLLSAKHLAMIEEALASVGEYGEVRLVVEKNRLRFIVTERSFDVQKWTPGKLNGDRSQRSGQD